MNLETFDKMVTEAVIAGQHNVLSTDRSINAVTNLVAEMLEIDPHMGDSMMYLLDHCYERGSQNPHAHWDVLVDQCKGTSSYKFLMEVRVDDNVD